MKDKIKYFIDMDGTIARFFDDKEYLEKMFKVGYFENLAPYEKMVDAVRKMIRCGKNVYILTKCVKTPYCVPEKIKWLAKYIPELAPDKIIMITDDKEKGATIKNLGLDGGVNVLFDDYGKNLEEWERNLPRGIAIKVYNGINGIHNKEYLRTVYAD